MERSLFTAAAFVAATTLLLGCSDDTGPEDPGPARLSLSQTQVSLKDGESITLTATVYDQDDRPMSGVAVHWSSANPEVATVENGRVTGEWPGTTEITASAGNASAKAVVIVTPFTNGLQRISGDGQQGLPGEALPDSLVVRVVDRHGNGVAGVPVSFVITAGGGSVSPANATTDAEGHAATEWVLGTSSVTQTVQARVGDQSSFAIEFTANAVEPSTVALGDTVLGAISTGGEVDTFTFAGEAGQALIVFYQSLDPASIVYVEFFEHYGLPTQRRLNSFLGRLTIDREWSTTSWFTLPSDGIYTIAVRGHDSTHKGAYRFVVFSIDPRPETVPSTVAIGDTIDGESIGSKGDVDEFTFTGTKGEEINIFLQPLGESDSLGLRLYEQYGTPSRRLLAQVRTSAASTLGAHSTGRVALPGDGTYTVLISGDPEGGVGAYRFHIFPIDRRPESVSPTVAIGDTIDGESISPQGDVDEFTFTGVEGQEINIFLAQVTGTGGLMLEVYEHFATPSQQVIARAFSGWGFTDLDIFETGRFSLPDDGTYTIVVSGSNTSSEGQYKFRIFPIDRRPESIPATVAIGDTIEGEGIYPKGDVDEFTFVGEAGQQVDIYVQSLIDCCGNFLFRVYDRYGTAEQTLLGEIFAYPTDSLEQLAISGLTLPRDDVYTIVVAGNWSSVTGPYRFHIRPRH